MRISPRRQGISLVPVVDLKGGRAVAASGGKRERYLPLETPLCRNGDPFQLIGSYLERLTPHAVYLADLDALTGRPPQDGLISALKRAFPSLRFWIDRGWPPARPDRQTVPVVGSEALTPLRLKLLPRLPHPWLLSLDFKRKFLGPPELLARRELWPEGVIAMVLERVGGGGPDFRKLAVLLGSAPERRWIAAGGVRHRGDLKRLERMGIEAVLVATALHRGALP